MNQLVGLDKFYTPRETARELVSMGGHVQGVTAVVDPACGDGSLLYAATVKWSGVRLRGLDIDRSAVARLRRRCGDWDVAVGSVYPRVHGPESWSMQERHDLVLTNPPFSMEKRRYREVTVGGKVYRCGLAMAHVLAAVVRLRPRVGVLAVMPESALYTELDSSARDLLAQELELRVGAEVRSSTFRGARVRTVLCAWLRPGVCGQGAQFGCGRGAVDVVEAHVNVSVLRGTLPVFRACSDARGLPYLHSTDLKLFRGGRAPQLRRVVPLSGGRMTGSAVLVSRVGMPRPEQVVTVNFRGEVQLSDCVIALATSSQREAVQLRKLVLARWEDFSGLYRGTGARFVTVARLVDWVAKNANLLF